MHIVAHVHRHAIQPGLDFLDVRQPVQTFVQAQERFLRRILRIGQISEQPQRRTQHLFLIRSHQLVESIQVARLRAIQESGGLPGIFGLQPEICHPERKLPRIHCSLILTAKAPETLRRKCKSRL